MISPFFNLTAPISIIESAPPALKPVVSKSSTQYVVSIFMLIFGINFTLFYFILIGKGKEILKNTEFKYGLESIGHSAFTNCINLTDTESEIKRKIQVIDNAFEKQMMISLLDEGLLNSSSYRETSEVGIDQTLEQVLHEIIVKYAIKPTCDELEQAKTAGYQINMKKSDTACCNYSYSNSVFGQLEKRLGNRGVFPLYKMRYK